MYVPFTAGVISGAFYRFQHPALISAKYSLAGTRCLAILAASVWLQLYGVGDPRDESCVAIGASVLDHGDGDVLIPALRKIGLAPPASILLAVMVSAEVRHPIHQPANHG